MNRNDVWGALAALGSIWGMKQAGLFGGGHAAAQMAAQQAAPAPAGNYTFKMPSMVDTAMAKYKPQPAFPAPSINPVPSYNRPSPDDDLLVKQAKEDALRKQQMAQGFAIKGIGQALGYDDDNQQAPAPQVEATPAPHIPQPQVAPSLTSQAPQPIGGAPSYLTPAWLSDARRKAFFPQY